GRKDAHSLAVRGHAMRIAGERGAEAASRATGVPAGTIRSWQRRAAKKAEREHESDGGVGRLRGIGPKTLAEREKRRAAEQADVEQASVPAPTGADLAALRSRCEEEWSVRKSHVGELPGDDACVRGADQEVDRADLIRGA